MFVNNQILFFLAMRTLRYTQKVSTFLGLYKISLAILNAQGALLLSRRQYLETFFALREEKLMEEGWQKLQQLEQFLSDPLVPPETKESLHETRTMAHGLIQKHMPKCQNPDSNHARAFTPGPK